MTRLHELIDRLAPEGVKHSRIGDITNVSAGATPASGIAEYWDNGTIPWMSSGEVNKGTVYDTDTKITQAGYDSCSTKLLPPNIVVMALAGQGKTRGLVARTRIALCTNQSLAAIVPKESVDADFLYYYLSTQYQNLRGISSGDGSRGGLNLQLISAYRVPVPPLEVQRAIAQILNTFTELEAELEAEREARRRQYGHYRDTLLTFSEAESDGVRWLSLGDFATLVRGHDLAKSDFTDSGVGCIHYGQIYTTYGAWTSTTVSSVALAKAAGLAKVDPGDLIVTNTSENVDDVCKAVAWLGDQQIVTGGHATVLKHSQDPKFLSYYFQTPAFHSQKRRLAAGAKVIDVSAKNLATIRVPIPPLDHQRRIVEILDKFDALVNDLSFGLPAELAARRKQYRYYRDRLLTFEDAA